jgi:hypothetical protein
MKRSIVRTRIQWENAFPFYNSIWRIVKIEQSQQLSDREEKDLENLPSTLMICYLNGFEDARQILIESKPLLKGF